MKRVNGFYIFVIALFAGMLFINFQYFRGSSFSNIGITYTKEYKISSERSGIIKNLHVVSGQEVKAGDLLVEMENAGLEIEIAQLSSKIDALNKEKQEKTSLMQSKIAFLKAESGIKIEELEAEINQIETEQNLNRRLTEQFISTGKSPVTTSRETADPTTIKIGSLQEKKKLYSQATSIRIEDFVKDHQTGLLVLENEISLKERELALMQSEKAKLNKYATYNGVVKSVYVRPGEEVEAYTAIIAINPRHPGTVVGYVVGPKGRDLAVGSTVMVNSYDHANLVSEGEVIGFGSIVELPEILQKSTAVKAFGKEVFIKIPEENAFANGEKVLIR
ncbi:hypothetical protein D770_26605 [Flammeovirgaceae bacterium 311]|nr:hypothetical protein D770_26605 [Flammeovirgaceae bacterium 311]